MTLESQRHLFDIPDEVAYLNCAYMSPNLTAVRVAGEQAIARKSRPWRIVVDDFFEDGEEARRLFASIVGGDAEGVALIPAASYGIGVAAANLPIGPGRSVVVLAEQFPSNVYPWQEAVAAGGGEVRFVPRQPDHDWTAAVCGAIDEATAVVALPNGHWTDGSIVDLAVVGEAARAAGAALVLDLTQSLGAGPFVMSVVQPDYVISAGYKWLLGPYSQSFMWVAPQHRRGRPIEFNWIARADSDDFAGLVNYRDDFLPGARRFDVGERSNFALLPMALAAMRQIVSWGVDAVAAYTAGLTAAVEEQAAALGLDPIPAGRRLPHLIGVRFPGGLPDGLSARLAAAGVFVSIRGDSIRISPHVYNTPRDVDRLFALLGEEL